MKEICKNCKNTISDNFCGNCGQKKYKRIDKKYIFDELQYTILHTNKGFFYSIKNILRNPGKTAREYIDGNRVNHYKPILLALVLGGITAFISFKILHSDKIVNDYYSHQFNVVKMNEQMENYMANFNKFYTTYYSLILLSTVPFFSLASYWAFKKWKFNYFEHIVLNTYYYIYYTLIGIILAPIMYFLNSSNPMLMTSLILVVTPFLLYWFYKGVNPEKHSSEIILNILKFLAFLIPIFLVTYVILIILFVIYIVLFIK
ncbi:DUF3667 domain-containing protein [Flavobacterium sp. I3-2]|uniref:DUF3667 domain-containing protein n=1 Tax=Flavobacterium sp. I3-2 TaxID=2748319 RepID=UPI0015B214D8|nr:DUF3667 domain-containing protein [Flavobacterium sp. I3-2]